jgi:Tol biopolymer transport system component
VRRLPFVLVLLVLWTAFGFGVNRFLDSRKSALITHPAAVAPPEETANIGLPGTVYVSQGGHLYRFHGGQFTDMKLPPADGSWIQPSLAGQGRLLLVARSSEFSDIYLVDAASGAILKQLTSNATRTRRVELNAWSFWPRLAADGSTVVSNYDGPKTGTSYEVHLAVWSGPLTGRVDNRQWTQPDGYTGGDVSPVPLPGGGVLYAKYSLNDKLQIVSRIATVAKPGATPLYLTAGADDCGEPAVNPDGSKVAVICTSDTQTAKLEVIPLVKGAAGVSEAAGVPQVLQPSCLCGSPTWSPDGTGLLYMAPADPTGHFQLWWLNHADTATPAAPRQVTNHLDLDATSAPAWTP